MHPTHRYRSRLWAGRLLLVLAVVLYGVALVVPMYSNPAWPRFWLASSDDQPTVGWQIFTIWAENGRRSWTNKDWLELGVVVGFLDSNVFACATTIMLTLGWVRFSRATALLAAASFWVTFAATHLVSPGRYWGPLEVAGRGRGAWLWLIAIHLVALAAFVTPRRPRPQVTD